MNTGCRKEYPNCRLHCSSPNVHRAMFAALTKRASPPPPRSDKIDYEKLQKLMESTINSSPVPDIYGAPVLTPRCLLGSLVATVKRSVSQEPF